MTQPVGSAPVRRFRPLPSVPPTYSGPVLLVTADAIRPDPIHIPIGASELLHKVASLKVPIVYLPTNQEEADLSPYPAGTRLSSDQVRPLMSAMPNAKFFVLAGNQGSDVTLAGTPGLTPYLRNTDFYQTDMPRDFSGIVTDEYYQEFRDRLLQDLSQAPGPRLAVYPNPPAVPVASRGDKLQTVKTKVSWAASGTRGVAGLGLRHRVHDRKHSVELARASHSVRMQATPASLGQAADDLLQAHLPAGDKSQLLYQVLTSHGTDAGHIDSILSGMRNPDQTRGTLHTRICGVLQGPERLAWLNRRDAGRPRVGDWKGDFEHYMDGLTGTTVRPGTRVKVCVNGEEAFKEQIDAIRNARQFINLSTFVFASDQFGRYYLSELEKAAERGVRINLVVDQTGSAKSYQKLPTDPHLFDKLLQHTNVQYVNTPDAPLDDHINHRKIMTMDNGKYDGQQVGFIGGMNIANDYRVRWHDVHCKLEGPALTDLNTAFADQLRTYGGTLDEATEARMLAPQTTYDEGSPVRVVPHWGFRDCNLKLAYLRAINTAAESIDIADPYVSDPDILHALEARARDGVKVRLFVPHHNNHAPMKWATYEHYKPMLAAGVQIFEYDGHEMAHEKVAVFDHRITTIGSSNLDARSMQDNEEANIWSSDPALAQEVEQRLFAADVPNSILITDHTPGRILKAQTKVAHLINPLL